MVLVLVDPFPFVANPPPEGLVGVDAVRTEAERAVFAIELARHAERTVAFVGNDPSPWLIALSEVCGLLPDLATLPPLPPLPHGSDSCGLLLHNYLRPLWAGLSSATVPALTWPRESFIDGDAPGGPLPATIEVAGRGRILAYGPYLPLPAGEWRATAFLGFSPDIDKLPFIFEAVTGTTSRGYFEVDRGGIFTIDLDFQVSDFLCPVELRLISQDSALEGQAALIEVRLKQISQRCSG